MMSSKKNLKKIFILGLSIILMSCGSSETSPYWGKEVAEFKVNSPSVEIVGEKIKDSFNFDQKANFNFRACITDLTGGNLPPGMDFAVQVGSGQEIPAKTDIDSCINWEREIGFSQLKAEKYYLLKTKFKSRNKLKGEITLDLLLNPVALSVTDMRNISASRRREIEEVKGDQVNISNITEQPKKDILTQVGKLPESNVITGNSVSTDYTVVIDAIQLEKIRLDVNQPFSVDEYLNLTTNNQFLFSVSPQFIVRRFGNPIEKIAPTRGLFKITLAFLAEPDFNVDDLFSKIQRLILFEDAAKLKGSSIRYAVDFDNKVDLFLKENANQLKREMSIDNKRLLMAKLMLALTHQTLQTQVEMTPQFGLQKEISVGLSQKALFPRRAMIAASVEPIGPEIVKPIKADGAGYVSNLYSPSSVSQFGPYKLEADLIHEQKIKESKQIPSLKPFELFASQAGKGQTPYYPIDTSDFSFSVSRFNKETQYDFANLVEEHFNRTLSKERQMLFRRALCHKFLSHPSLSSFNANRLQDLRRGCESTIFSTPPYYAPNVREVGFVESVNANSAVLDGPVLGSSLTINQSFSRAGTSSQDKGSTFSSSVGVDGSIGIGGSFGVDFLKLPTKPIAFPENSPLSASAGLEASVGFKASMGQSWYYTSTKSKSTSGTTDIGLTTSFKINIEGSRFVINANVKRCLILLPNQMTERIMNSAKVKLPSFLYVCSKKLTKISQKENYFLVKQDCLGDSPIADCSSDQENKLTMMIRGTSVFKAFENIVSNAALETQLMPVSNDALRSLILPWESSIKTMSVNQIYPGMLVLDSKLKD
jgi:hypothetical protein